MSNSCKYKRKAGLSPGSGENAARLFLRLVRGDRTGRGDDFNRIGRSGEVEERLCGFAQRRAVLRDQHERALHNVTAVLDGFYARYYAVDLDGIDGVLKRR